MEKRWRQGRPHSCSEGFCLLLKLVISCNGQDDRDVATVADGQLLVWTIAILYMAQCRVYRGDMPASKDPGMFFVAEGGPVRVRDVEAYTMRSIWEDPGDIPAKYHEPAAE